MAERYALVVSISKYHSSLGNLTKPSGDAKAFAQVLREHGKFDTTLLTETVSSDDLKQAFEVFLTRQAVGSDALIYFTGHGFTLTESENYKTAFLATSTCEVTTSQDYDVSLQNNLVKVPRVIAQRYGIPFNFLNQLISESNLSSLVVLLDCCHSGYFVQEESVKSSLTAFTSAGKNYCCIAACQDSEVARAKRDGKHSVFTGALLEALKPESSEDGDEISSLMLLERITRDPALKKAGQRPTHVGFGLGIPIVSYAPLKDPQHSADRAIPTFNAINPYQGLKAFEKNQAEYFGGREQAINDLQELVNQHQVLVVTGPSGCGKSSLVKAGLLPRLQQLPDSSQWEVEESFTPGNDPLYKLQTVLKRHRQPKQPFVLFIDQFEELFTLCQDDSHRRQFIEVLAKEATNKAKYAKVIIATRSSFLERFFDYAEAKPLVDLTQRTKYSISPLTVAELQDAIEKPAKQHGAIIKPDLVSEIVSVVRDKPAKDQTSALPLLQHALWELWEECIKDSSQELTWDGYREIGGVLGALQKRANFVFESFDKDTERPLVKQLMLELAQTVEGQEIVVRRRETRQHLLAIAKSDKLLQKFIDRFSQDGLIVINENTIEVAHEQLFSAWTEYKEWIKDNRENSRLRDRLNREYDEWLAHGKSDDYLLAAGPFLAVQDWVENYKPKLSDDKKEFLKKSQDKRDREANYKLQLKKEKAEQARDYERQLKEKAERAVDYQRQLKEKAERTTKLTIAVASLATVTFGMTGLALMSRLQLTNNAVNYAFGFLDKKEIERLLPQGGETAKIALEEAKKIEESGNIDEAINRYRVIRNKLQDMNWIEKQLKGKQKLEDFSKEAEKNLIRLIEKYKISRLKTDYLDKYSTDKIVLGERITDITIDNKNQISQLFTPGALQKTYEILMWDAGGDLDENGVLNSYQEADKIPCETLKSLEEKWKELDSGCYWYGSEDHAPACKPLQTSFKQPSLQYEVISRQSNDFFMVRVKDCKSSGKW